jgi:hypothetical protein
MKQIHLDISILEDINAFNQNESGKRLLELLELYIQKHYIIIIERRPVNSIPEIITTLAQGDSFNKFFNHWSNLFKQ